MSQREIKFRVWDAFHQKMSYPRPSHPTHIDTEYSIVVSQEVENEGNYVPRSQNDVTIEQYTGLKDSTGREIYEGDIIQAAVLTDDEYISPVPDLTAFHWFQELEVALEEGKPCRVIGNIHQNPELLS